SARRIVFSLPSFLFPPLSLSPLCTSLNTPHGTAVLICTLAHPHTCPHVPSLNTCALVDASPVCPPARSALDPSRLVRVPPDRPCPLANHIRPRHICPRHFRSHHVR
ncbi:hypothetical protein DENSPDRAFT_914059, partial [Dentipellis sp. KUC8613]